MTNSTESSLQAGTVYSWGPIAILVALGIAIFLGTIFSPPSLMDVFPWKIERESDEDPVEQVGAGEPVEEDDGRAEREPIEAGEHHVGGDGVEAAAADCVPRVLAVHPLLHVRCRTEAALEAALHVAAHLRVVDPAPGVDENPRKPLHGAGEMRGWLNRAVSKVAGRQMAAVSADHTK